MYIGISITIKYMWGGKMSEMLLKKGGKEQHLLYTHIYVYNIITKHYIFFNLFLNTVI